MLSTRSAATVCFAAAAFVSGVRPATAQNESALKSYFEGRRVTLRIDMPGSSDGVNLRNGEMDIQDYRNNLRQFGVSIRAGDSVVVTLVKTKKDLIEFQLGGGGFGTFSDDTSTSPDTPLLEKSDREKRLEQRVKDEKDPDERRRLRRDLDQLRERRERENRRIEVIRERESEVKAERVAEARLRGGSRFNLRYERAVPAGITPDDVIRALVEYVDFAPADRRAADEIVADPPAPPDFSMLRKGMLRADVERAFGRPAATSERREGSLTIVTLVFVSDDQRIAIDFVDDVLVRYTLTSK